MRSRETRDLLKSTLVVAWCAPYTADHVLGHAPRDSYEKQAVLYPEALRREYAKASGMINILAGIEGYLGAAGDAPAAAPSGEGRGGREILDQLRLVREDLRRVAGAVAGIARAVAPEGGLPGEASRAIRDPEWGRTGGAASGRSWPDGGDPRRPKTQGGPEDPAAVQPRKYQPTS